MASDGKPTKVPEAVARFDTTLFPERALLDTGIWLRVFHWEQDADSQLCIDLVTALSFTNCRMLMSAPTLAELLRADDGRKVPRTRSIVPVPFDTKAAEELQLLVAPWKNTTPGEGVRLKFDQMIVACAVRWGAQHIIHLDNRLRNSAPRAEAKVAFRKPADYMPALLAGIEASKLAEAKAVASGRKPST